MSKSLNTSFNNMLAHAAVSLAEGRSKKEIIEIYHDAKVEYPTRNSSNLLPDKSSEVTVNFSDISNFRSENNHNLSQELLLSPVKQTSSEDSNSTLSIKVDQSSTIEILSNDNINIQEQTMLIDNAINSTPFVTPSKTKSKTPIKKKRSPKSKKKGSLTTSSTSSKQGEKTDEKEIQEEVEGLIGCDISKEASETDNSSNTKLIEDSRESSEIDNNGSIKPAEESKGKKSVLGKKKRWAKIDFLLVKALSMIPENQGTRSQIFAAADSFLKQLNKENSSIKICNSKTPKNSYSSALTNNTKGIFEKFNVPGNPIEHFKPVFPLDNFEFAYKKHQEWNEQLYSKVLGKIYEPENYQQIYKKTKKSLKLAFRKNPDDENPNFLTCNAPNFLIKEKKKLLKQNQYKYPHRIILDLRCKKVKLENQTYQQSYNSLLKNLTIESNPSLINNIAVDSNPSPLVISPIISEDNAANQLNNNPPISTSPSIMNDIPNSLPLTEESSALTNNNNNSPIISSINNATNLNQVNIQSSTVNTLNINNSTFSAKFEVIDHSSSATLVYNSIHSNNDNQETKAINDIQPTSDSAIRTVNSLNNSEIEVIDDIQLTSTSSAETVIKSRKHHREQLPIPTNWKDLFYVGPSTIKGANLGLFAKRFVPKDTVIGYYFGVPTTEYDFDKHKGLNKYVSSYSIKYYDFILDATDNNNELYKDKDGGILCPFHFMNEHPDFTNVRFNEGSELNQVECITECDVFKGQELFVFYGVEYEREYQF
ncbi:hypothetical protein K502DRAFT_345001 [Neoconidiobolus thromboides FSU 785]|nr:hypothetical protein K502DRAFT_345001 [Neoconidiobolus thromboides FSU 785]